MTADLRLGMIGAGWIADRHLQSVSELPQVSVVAVADLDLARAQRVASAAVVPPAGTSTAGAPGRRRRRSSITASSPHPWMNCIA